MPRLLHSLLLAAGALAFLTSDAAAQAAEARCATPDLVIFRGGSRVDAEALRGTAALPTEGAISARDLQRAVKALYAVGEFEDVRTACEIAADGRASLVFTIRERPLLDGYSVTGTNRVATGTVRDRVDLPKGRALDPAAVAKAVQRIDSLYESRGFYLARVTVDTAAGASGVSLTFNVEEGQRLAVSGVRITGNQLVADNTIVGAMKTRPEGFLWWRRGEFDDDAYAGDLTERIPELYANRGFIDMQVVRDTVIIDRELGKALVEITVSEGPQYHVGTFDVAGARRFSDEELRRYYPFTESSRTLTQTVRELVTRDSRPRDVFDASRWQEATQRVQNAYANEGYIYAAVRPVTERVVGPDSTPRVNLRWDVDERTPAIVNRVEVVGNDYTTESCIREQIWLLPGDVFNQDRLVQSYQNINNLGFFDSPLPTPDTRQANEQGDVDIIFRVKEKRTGQVSFGASAGGTGLGGFLGLEQPNLFGLCKRGSLQYNFGRNLTDFNLAFTDPSIAKSRISGTVNAYHTRSRYNVGGLGQIIRTGGQVQTGFPVPRSRFTRLFLSYGGERQSYGESGLAGTINCPNCFRSTVGLSLTRDTRIDLPFPSAGAQQTLSSQFNGGPLGGTASFQRYTGELRSYSTIGQLGGDRPGSQPVKLVVGLSTRAGAIFGSTGPFFPTQAFALGGVQFGEPLRGYSEFTVTPRGVLPGEGGGFQARPESFGNAYFTTTAELGVRVSQQLYVNMFYDAGNVWARARDFDPSRLIRGAGVGASVITPLGPLGLDLGYGFDRVDERGRRAPQWQMHFKLGQIF